MVGSAQSVICPDVAIVAEAADVTEFGAGAGRDVVDMRYFAEFSDVRWSCDLDGSTLEVELDVVLTASAGPVSRAQTADLTFFVALAEQDGGLIAKQTFATTIALTSDKRTGGVAEEIEQRIPLRADQNGADFEILIGFQITREQLQYNRARGAR